MSDAPTIVTFRRNTLIMRATIVAIIPGTSICFVLAPSLIVVGLALGIPILIAVWSWRSGTDANADGLVVRTTFGSRRIPWSAVVDLVPEPDGRLSAHLASGQVLALPAVSPRDRGMLLAASSTIARSPDATASIEDLRARVVTSNNWRLAAVIVSVYLAFCLTAASVTVERLVPTHMVSDVPTVKQLPAGGWPFAFLYDSPCCSVIGRLGLEDTFKPGWFLADAAVFSALPVVVGIVLSRRWRRSSWPSVDVPV